MLERDLQPGSRHWSLPYVRGLLATWGKPHRSTAEEPIPKGSSSGQAATKPQLPRKAPGSLLPREREMKAPSCTSRQLQGAPEPVPTWRAAALEWDEGGATHSESAQVIAYLLGSSVGSSLG